MPEREREKARETYSVLLTLKMKEEEINQVMETASRYWKR